jgi:hypothetical protein
MHAPSDKEQAQQCKQHSAQVGNNKNGNSGDEQEEANNFIAVQDGKFRSWPVFDRRSDGLAFELLKSLQHRMPL